MNEIMERWLMDNPNATPREAFESAWMACTAEWCHNKREKMEQLIELMKEIIG